MIQEEKFLTRTKHIDTKKFFVKDFVDKGVVIYNIALRRRW